jgi:hypothetical protein
MIREGVWIGNWIYSTPTNRNYKQQQGAVASSLRLLSLLLLPHCVLFLAL